MGNVIFRTTGYQPLDEAGAARPSGVCEAEQGKAPAPDRKSIFWCRDEGVYFTYTTQQIRIAMCRAVIQTVVVIGIFLAYFLLWDFWDAGIFMVAAGSCGASCLGIAWLTPSCFAGAVASIIKGVRLGSQIAHVDVQWRV